MAKILRIETVLDRTGDTKSPLYDKIAKGLFPRPFKIGGARAAGLLEDEVDGIIAARASGASDDAIRTLVQKMHEARALARPLAAGSAK